MFLDLSIGEIHALLKEGKLDPKDVTDECISAITKYDSRYHAWVTYDVESLTRKAKELKKAIIEKRSLRPLDGIPVGVKDVFNTTDFPTEMGSPIWRNFTPGNDARVVYYLKNAGAFIAGKTVTAEFAVHALNETLNPHDITVTPGTSSSGSAVAVSLGMVPVALGTQTGASIIRPASFCGVYGFKPSFGLLPRTGSLKTTDSLDTVGFFVAKPADLRRVLDVLRVTGPNFPFIYKAFKDPSRITKPKDRPWKVALINTYTMPLAADYARDAIRTFASTIGNLPEIQLTEINLPPQFSEVHEIHAAIYDKSLAYYFAEESRHNHLISAIMNNMIDRGNRVSSNRYLESLDLQANLINQMDELMSEQDICFSLSTAGQAPPRDISETPDPSLIWTFTHLPALNIPCFQSPQGLPFGLQLIARKYDDYKLLEFVEHLRSVNIIPNGPFRCKASNIN